ncbi:unnamed protein product [Echinostoma caproni]|uniref:Uncharacterized protein n=1 Tax=Echinostoma caproni TaxID=27848 RepID=A0A183AQT8_9TREM|nr:unnamed protein product [Echinostoma caproni]
MSKPDSALRYNTFLSDLQLQSILFYNTKCVLPLRVLEEVHAREPGEADDSTKTRNSTAVQEPVIPKEQVTVEAQTRTPVPCLTIDAASNRQQTPVDQDSTNYTVSTSEISSKSRPASFELSSKEDVLKIVKEIANKTPFRLLECNKTGDSESQCTTNAGQSNTLTIDDLPIPENKKASFRVLGWQWDADSQSEMNSNINGDMQERISLNSSPIPITNVYMLVREDIENYIEFLVQYHNQLFDAMDEFMRTLDEPEISVKVIRESETESSTIVSSTLHNSVF